MDNRSSISLLGCGWLGFPLAKSLISKGFKVMATTTSKSKLKILEREGIDPYLVHFAGGLPIPGLKKFFAAKTLIITIPPGRSDPNGLDNYRQMIQFVCTELPSSNISRVILISSTSVYADDNNEVDELSKVAPETDSGRMMAESEKLLTEQKTDITCLRFAGLIGPARMPGRFFAGKKNVPNGFAPINLLHLSDAIGIINAVIDDARAIGIYNGCAPIHPTRTEFYTLAAEMEGLEKPHFISEKHKWKIVSCPRLAEELNYQFEIPSPVDWLLSLESI